MAQKFRSILSDQQSPSLIVAGVTGIIVVRTFLEAILEEHTLSRNVEFYDTLLSYLHIYISWMLLFACMALLLSLFARIRLQLAWTNVLYISPLIITVPLIDYATSGGQNINYGHAFSDFTHNYLNLFNPFASISMVPLGVRLEIFAATTAGVLTVWKYYNASVPRALLFGVCLYSTIFGFGYLPALFPGLLVRLEMGYLPVYLPVFLAVMAGSALKLIVENRIWIRVFAELLFPTRMLFYLLVLIIGMFFSRHQMGFPSGTFKPADFVRLAFGLISIALLFVHAKIDNDLHDVEIDKISNPHRIPLTHFIKELGGLDLNRWVLLFSFLFAMGAEPYFFLPWFFIMVLASLYSNPPFRLRRFYPLGHYLISLIGAGVFVAGATIGGSKLLFEIKDVPMLIVCTFVAFFFLSHVKDLKDIDADAQCGVMNIYSITGLPKTVCLLSIGGFVGVLLMILNVLTINHLPAYLVLAVYLVITVIGVCATKDVRKLDWIIGVSMLLILSVGLIWAFDCKIHVLLYSLLTS